MTSQDKKFRNIVVGLFIGFFLAAGIGIGIGIHYYKVRQLQLQNAMIESKQKVENIMVETNTKIDSLNVLNTQKVDSLHQIIFTQQVKIENLTFVVTNLRREQKQLAIELENIAADRDSSLQRIQIQE